MFDQTHARIVRKIGAMKENIHSPSRTSCDRADVILHDDCEEEHNPRVYHERADETGKNSWNEGFPLAIVENVMKHEFLLG
jgi:hypothetical protein